jgi:drug/metabolite transporter (DMT)-like permease
MNRKLQADLALAFCMLVWGATFVVVKDALSYASVFVFLAVRFSFATVLMGIVSWKVLRRMDRATFVAGASIGILMAAGYAFQTLGLKFTTPSKSGFINGSSVLLVPVLLAAFGRRRINRWVWAGALAALAGLYYLSVPAAGLAQLNKGDLLTLGAAFMFALQIIVVARRGSLAGRTATSGDGMGTAADCLDTCAGLRYLHHRGRRHCALFFAAGVGAAIRPADAYGDSLQPRAGVRRADFVYRVA